MASFINKKCTSCKVCEPICPTGSISPGEGKFVIDSDTCEDCHLCIPVCPEKAIQEAKQKANR